MASNTYGAIKLSTAEDVGAVLKKKTGSADGYKPKEWADTINLLGLLPIRTASGTIAHFSDGADDVPMKSVVANIVPIQSGSGTPSPSNPRPISGTSALNVEQTGKNLFDKEAISNQKWLSTTTGLEEPAVSYCVSDFIPVEAGKTVFIPNSGTARRWFYDVNKNPVTYLNNSSNQAYTPNANGYIRVSIAIAGSDAKDINTYQIELGSTATTFEPYNAETYTIDLGQEIMGGTADCVGGVGSKTHGSVDLGSLTWTYHSASGQYTEFFDCYLPNDSIQGTSSIAFDGYCSIYKSIPSGNIATSGYDNNVMALAQGTRRFIVCDQRFHTKEDFETAMSGIYLIYPLATPTDFTFTGQPINSYLGVNNVWTDSGEVLDVEYRADMNILIAELGG